MQNYIPSEQLDARVRIAKRKRPTPSGHSPLQAFVISNMTQQFKDLDEGAKKSLKFKRGSAFCS